MSARSIACVTAAVVCALAVRAEANVGKAWAAAKANLPAETAVVIGVDVGTITQSSLFTSLFPLLMSQQRELKKGLDLIKSSCKLDPLTAINGIVIGSDAAQERGAMFLSVSGLDEAKLGACLEAVARAEGAMDAALKGTKDGPITELAIGGERLYLAWFGKDVVAIGLDFDNKARLAEWIGGKGALARSPVGKAVAKVNTRAAMWGASAVPKQLDDVAMKAGYGALTLTKGTLGLDLHVVVESAKTAAGIAAKAKAELQRVGAAADTELATVVKQIAVTSSGAEVVVRGKLAEQDVMTLLGALL